RANTNLRLVARMADVEESIDVLDDPAAAHLPVGVPGRVLMRVGAAPPTPVQVAFTGTPTAHRSAVAVMPLTLDPPPGGPPTVAPATARPPVTEADAVVRATQTAARDRRADRLWLEPLPTRLSDPTVVAGEDGHHLLDRAAPDAAQVRATAGWPLAVADLPRRRARAVWSLDPAGGVVLVLGGAGSGRTSALEAIAATAAGHGAGAVGIDGAGGRLAGLDGATAEHRTGAAAESGGDARPGLGAFVAVSDDERLARLLWWLEQRGGATPCVLAIDGWEGVWDRGQLPGASDVIVRLVELARTARARRLTVAVGAGRAGALPPELRSARSELVALAGAERDPDLGLDHPPPSGAPPGRARLVTAQAHLLGGESDPTEGPLVQLRRPPPPSAGQGRNDGGSHPAVASGDAPLIAPHPARIRLEVGLEIKPGPNPDVGSPSTDSGRHDPGVIVGVDLERDLPVVAPATGPFWVLGRPRSGRSTTLATLAAQATAGRPGGRVLVSARAPIGPTQHPWTTTLEAPARLHDGLPGPVTSVALVAIDDADRLDDDGWAALDRWLGALPEHGRDPLLAVAADPAALDRWNPVVSSLLGHGAGLLLSPEPDEDGRLLGGDLPRHRPFAMSAGRGYLVVRGTGARPVQVAWPHA
ncbi:MAG: hypothetical protein KDB24_14575, partial [Microthrixaceae bacterium]|nr:hypothetical protein [Microthrixaceae bacterium]